MSFFDRTFRDKHGHIALLAWPNVPLWIWIASKFLQWPLTGTAERFARDVGVGALLVWASLELVQGVNYFRRALGLVVLVLTIISIFRGV